jgi:putative transposase
MVERFNEEIKMRIRVAPIFPNASCCLKLIRALAVEIGNNLGGPPRLNSTAREN